MRRGRILDVWHKASHEWQKATIVKCDNHYATIRYSDKINFKTVTEKIAFSQMTENKIREHKKKKKKKKKIIRTEFHHYSHC